MESLNNRDSPVIGRVITGVKVSVVLGASAPLPKQCKDAMDLGFEEMKRVKTLVFSKVSKEGREGSVEDSLKSEKNIPLEKDCEGPICRPIA